MARTKTGRLVICPTPLGNLEDITLRTLRALRECDELFAEDTRVTSKLLRHYGIDKPVRSYHERVEPRRLRELQALLAAGKTVAVVTDAGMPAISDPGSEVVRAAREVGAAVEALPGPSAFVGALVLSGFDVSRFRFEGFPPRKAGERRAHLRSLTAEPRAVVSYEAPSRIIDLLADVETVLPDRRVFVLREYTKMFEQHALGTAAEVRRQIEIPTRGEFVVVLEGSAKAVEHRPAVTPAVLAAVAAMIRQGAGARTAAEGLALATGLPKNALYRLAVALKEKAPRRRR